MPSEKKMSGEAGKIVEKPKFWGLSRNIYVLGLGSLLTDISSEMIYPILPLFLVSVLRAPMTVVGLIESIAESTASLVKVFSGWLSDRAGRRKPLLLSGYGLSNFAKPFLTIVGSWPQVLAVRFADRFGKGVRTSPRDALIADVSEERVRGKAFGLHRSMDTLGAALGPLLAFFILLNFERQFRLVFLVAAFPGILAFFALLFFVREKRTISQPKPPEISFRKLGGNFTFFTVICSLFALGNSSDAFLILRAQNLGVKQSLIPLLYFFFNAAYSFLSVPAGMLSDKIGRVKVIGVGFFLFSFLYLGFALAGSVLVVWILFISYGAYYALTEGVQRAMVTDLVSKKLRGTAMGTFNFAVGIATLPASLIAGTLWQYAGPEAAFYYGSLLAFLSGLLLLFWQRRRTSSIQQP